VNQLVVVLAHLQRLPREAPHKAVNGRHGQVAERLCSVDGASGRRGVYAKAGRAAGCPPDDGASARRLAAGQATP